MLVIRTKTDTFLGYVHYWLKQRYFIRQVVIDICGHNMHYECIYVHIYIANLIIFDIYNVYVYILGSGEFFTCWSHT